MRCLVIDTAGPLVGVAAWAEGRCVEAASARVDRGADGWLGPVLQAQLRTLGRLDRVVVTVGPGAFTGLRVGVASALGLAVALGVPVRCISSLALRACLVPGRPRVLALLDAKQGKLYRGVYDTIGAPEPLEPESDVAPEHALSGGPAWVVGEGAKLVFAELNAAGHQLVDGFEQSAVSVAGPLLDGPAVPPEQVALRYLRAPSIQLSGSRGPSPR